MVRFGTCAVTAICVAGLLALSAAAVAQPAQKPLRLAQDAAYCRNWAARLQSEQASFNARCSGQLDQNAYSSCQNWQNRLSAEIQSYNASCGR